MPRVKERAQKLGRSPKVAPTPNLATADDVSSSRTVSDNAGHGGTDARGEGASTKGAKKANRDSSKIPSKKAKVDPPSQSKKRKWRPGTVALREIRKYQKSEMLLIPRAPFARLCREVMNDVYTREDMSWWRRIRDVIPHRWSATALLAIQSAAEAYLVDLMHDGQYAAIHRKRITLTKQDFCI